MYFLIGMFIFYFIFSIRPIMRFYKYKELCERLQKDLQKANDEIKSLKLQSSVKDIHPAKEENIPPRSSNFSSYLPPKVKENNIYGTTPMNTWGALWAKYPNYKGSLSADQQALVKYPRMNKNCVYYTRTGNSYHSVSWCYTIPSNSQTCTLIEAVEKGLKPCSKCVSKKQLEHLEEYMEW